MNYYSPDTSTANVISAATASATSPAINMISATVK